MSISPEEVIEIQTKFVQAYEQKQNKRCSYCNERLKDLVDDDLDIFIFFLPSGKKISTNLCSHCRTDMLYFRETN